MNRRDNTRDTGGELFAKCFKIVIIGLVVLTLVAVGFMVVPPFIKINIAKVGSEKVRDYEFRYLFVQAKSNAYELAKQNNPNLSEKQFWSTPIDGQNAIDVVKKQVLDKIKEDKIQVIKAKAAGTVLTENEKAYIKQIIDSIISKQGSKELADQYYKGTYGITLDQLNDIYYQQSLAGKFVQNQITGMKLAEADIKTFYEKYPDKYKTFTYRTDGGEAVWVSDVMIAAASDASAADKEKAKQKAQEILDKIKNGSDFTAVKKEYSSDTSVQVSSFVFGKGGTGDTAFENVAFALKPGDLSDIVLGTDGYHIIKLQEKYAKGEPVSLKCAQESNNFGLDYVKQQKYQIMLDGWKKDAAYDVKITNKRLYNSFTAQ